MSEVPTQPPPDKVDRQIGTVKEQAMHVPTLWELIKALLRAAWRALVGA